MAMSSLSWATVERYAAARDSQLPGGGAAASSWAARAMRSPRASTLGMCIRLGTLSQRTTTPAPWLQNTESAVFSKSLSASYPAAAMISSLLWQGAYPAGMQLSCPWPLV